MDDLNTNNFLLFHSVTNVEFSNYIQCYSTNNNFDEQRFDFNYINNLCFRQFESYKDDDDDLLNDFFNNFETINDCNYYLNSDEVTNNVRKSLSLCCLNINSIPKNILAFSTQCLSNFKFSFDVLGFVETKLSPNIEHLYNIPSYSKYTLNCKRNSGGLAVFFKDNLNVKLRPDLNRQLEFIETLFIEIETKRKNIVCGIIYRRPIP